MGSPNAKVTMIEYASMTCSHCAAFATKVYPTLKSKYIDTGKAKLILREFPLDPLATGMAAPLYGISPPGDLSRMFVLAKVASQFPPASAITVCVPMRSPRAL